MSKVKDITNYLLEKYPLCLASNFDQGKVGLQFGNKEKEVKKVLICLDATSDVVKEALSLSCDMIISHHPFMFSPMLNMDYNDPFGKKMLNVFQNELNIFAMHTNFDVAANGMNELLSKMVGMKNVYSIPEEPDDTSFLRFGEVEETTLKEFALKVKSTFKEEGIRVVGDLNKKVKKVAIIGGSGGIFVMDAKRRGADVIITGEIRHNNAIDALDYNIGIIEVSHSVEAHFKSFVKEDLQNNFKDVEFILATKDVNPFKCL